MIDLGEDDTADTLGTDESCSILANGDALLFEDGVKLFQAQTRGGLVEVSKVSGTRAYAASGPDFLLARDRQISRLSPGSRTAAPAWTLPDAVTRLAARPDKVLAVIKSKNADTHGQAIVDVSHPDHALFEGARSITAIALGEGEAAVFAVGETGRWSLHQIAGGADQTIATIPGGAPSMLVAVGDRVLFAAPTGIRSVALGTKQLATVASVGCAVSALGTTAAYCADWNGDTVRRVEYETGAVTSVTMENRFLHLLAIGGSGLFFTQSAGRFAQGVAFLPFATSGGVSASTAPVDAAGPSQPSTTGVGSYRNAKFGYRLDVPSPLEPRPEEPSGAGRYFYSADEAVYLKAWGGEFGATVSDVNALFDKKSASANGRTVSYHARGPDWFVVSGRAGAKLFYERVVVSGSHYAEASITYPASARSLWDKRAADTALSLTFH